MQNDCEQNAEDEQAEHRADDCAAGASDHLRSKRRQMIRPGARGSRARCDRRTGEDLFRELGHVSGARALSHDDCHHHCRLREEGSDAERRFERDKQAIPSFGDEGADRGR